MPTTALRKKNQLLCAKLETTYDTDAVPTVAADSLLAIDPKIKEVVDPVRRPANIASLSRTYSVAGQRYAEVSFKMEVKGSGSINTAPRIGCLLRACGFSATIVSGTSITYTPVSSSFDSITIYLFIDGRRHVVTGARGDVKITCEAGQMAVAEFTFKGRYATPTLVALSSPTLESTVPQICKSCAFTYSTKTTLVLKSVLIEMNNDVIARPSISDANSIAGFEITGRDPMVTIDPEAIIETSYTFREDSIASTLRALSWVVGATTANIVTFSIPKYNLYFPEYEDRDEILVEKIKGEACQNTGNDEVSIAFT
jgi:hypothetical protein